MTEWLEANAPPMLLALMGGVADYLTSDEHSLCSFFVGAFLSCFTGYMVLLMCNEYSFSQGKTGMICGFAGYSSRSLLLMVKKVNRQRLLQWLMALFGVALPLTDVKKKTDTDMGQEAKKDDSDS